MSRHVGLKPDRLGEVFYRGVEIAGATVGVTPKGVGRRGIRLEFDRLGVVGNRSFEFAFGSQSVSAPDVGERIFGFVRIASVAF